MLKFKFSIRNLLLIVSLIAIVLAIIQSESVGEREVKRIASLDFSANGSQLAVSLYQCKESLTYHEVQEFRRTISILDGATLSMPQVSYRDRPVNETFLQSDRFDDENFRHEEYQNQTPEIAEVFAKYQTIRFWHTQSQVKFYGNGIVLIGPNARQIKILNAKTGGQKDWVSVERDGEIHGFDTSLNRGQILFYGISEQRVPLLNPEMLEPSYDKWYQFETVGSIDRPQPVAFTPTAHRPPCDVAMRFLYDVDPGGLISSYSYSVVGNLVSVNGGSPYYSNLLDLATSNHPIVSASIFDGGRLRVDLIGDGGPNKHYYGVIRYPNDRDSLVRCSPTAEIVAVSTDQQIRLYDFRDALRRFPREVPAIAMPVRPFIQQTISEPIRLSMIRATYDVIQHNRKITAFDFSPDGKTIAIGDDQGFVSLWDVAEGKKIAECAAPSALRGLPWQLTTAFLVAWVLVFLRVFKRPNSAAKKSMSIES